jgi:hypothetical protein
MTPRQLPATMKLTKPRRRIPPITSSESFL